MLQAIMREGVQVGVGVRVGDAVGGHSGLRWARQLARGDRRPKIATWLAQQMPEQCDPPGEFEQLYLFGERLNDYLLTGSQAIQQADPHDPQLLDALERWGGKAPGAPGTDRSPIRVERGTL